MKKTHFYIILLACVSMSNNICADHACPDTFSIAQPDSSIIAMRIQGDEWFHWNSTSDNIPIIKNNDGVFEYALIKDSIFVPTGMKAHNPQERTTKEKTFISQTIISDFQRNKLNEQIKYSHQHNTANRKTGPQTPNTTGTLRYVTILMQFPDRAFQHTAASFDSLLNQPNYSSYGNYGSVYDYYYENSSHQLTTQSIVVGPFTAQYDLEYYSTGDYSSGISSSKVRTLIMEAVEASKAYVDYSTCDNNNDGYVDLVHVVFAGHSKSVGANYSTIWPHRWQLPRYINDDGKKILDYIITAEYNNANGTDISAIGTICHELGHTIGAPDFYDTNTSTETFYATGMWDVMAGGNHNDSRHRPAMHNPYTISQIFGWREVQNITTQNTSYTLLPIETSLTQKYYRINTSTTGEYFLLENRRRTGWDYSVPYFSDGLLIYHIHSDLASNNYSNINDTHPLKCYIVNCSATTEPNTSPSSYGSLYYAAYPGLYNNKRFFNSNSTPRAQSWDGNTTTKGLYYIQKVGNNIQFMVNPNMNGSTTLCNYNSYSINGIPSSASIHWTYETDIQQVDTFPVLRLSSTTASSITVQRGFYRFYHANIPGPDVLYSGYATLKATVICDGDTSIYTKTLFMHEDVTPILPASSLTQIGWQETRTFSISNCMSVSGNNLKWIVTMPQATTTNTYYGRNWTVTPTTPGTLNIKLYNLENCSTTLHSNYNIIVDFRIPDPFLTHPNPISSEFADIHIYYNKYFAQCDRNCVEEDLKPVPYSLEIWDDHSHSLKTIVGNLCSPEENIKVNLGDFRNGIYLLTLRTNDKIVSSSKLIINR